MIHGKDELIADGLEEEAFVGFPAARLRRADDERAGGKLRFFVSEHDAERGSEAEIAEFRQSDIAGGGSIVVLMAAIFTIGLVLYGIIAIVTNLTLYGFDP